MKLNSHQTIITIFHLVIFAQFISAQHSKDWVKLEHINGKLVDVTRVVVYTFTIFEQFQTIF